MQTTQYRAVFKYDGLEADSYSRLNKRILEKIYVECYSLFCELVNPHFEKWNAEYSGPNDYVDENGCINPKSQYTSYINERETEVVKNNIVIERFFIGDESDFRMQLKDGTTMQMYLRPEN